MFSIPERLEWRRVSRVVVITLWCLSHVVLLWGQRLQRQADSLFDRLEYCGAVALYERVLGEYPVHDSLYFSIQNRLAEALWWQGKYTASERVIRYTLPEAVLALGDAHTETGKLYLNLGIVSSLTMNSGLTYEYMEKARDIFLARYGLWHPLTATAFEWLGTMHEGSSDTALALVCLNQALRLRKRMVPPDDLSMGNISRYFGLYYKRFAKPDSAKLWFNRALRIFDHYYGPDNFQSVKCLNNLCDIYQEANRPDTTMAMFKEALRRTERARGEKGMARFMTLFNLSEFMASLGRYPEAVEYLQQTIALYDSGFRWNAAVDNPATLPDGADHYLKLVFLWKSSYLMSYYEKDPGNRVAYLQAVLTGDSMVDCINNRIRERILSYDNLLAYEQILSRVYFTFALHALKAYEVTGNSRYFSRALTYLETNRNLQLIQSVDPNGKILFDTSTSNTAAAVVTRCRSLQNDINDLKNRLLYIKDKAGRDACSRMLRDKKIELDQYYYGVSQQDFQRGSSLFISPEISLKELQRSIDPTTMMLEIVELFPNHEMIPDQFLLIGITREKIAFRFVKGDLLYDPLIRFTGLVSTPSSHLTALLTEGETIRRLVLEPFDDIREERDQVVIIPSLHTWLIPFEALPSRGKASPGGTGYLIDDLTIWREFSMVSWMKGVGLKNGSHGHQVGHRHAGQVLAVAPRFHQHLKQELSVLTRRDTSFIDLPGSRKECEAIAMLFPTRMVTGFDATEELFDSLAPTYGIVHLSTHGIPSRTDSGVLMLAFNAGIDDSLHNGFLNLYEILNMHLDNELVVLSACKSALGVPNKSEGNLNLAWAFRDAGVTSVIVSLWDVNDYASSEIMPRFYAGLAAGLTKPEALRRAKQAFLHTHDQAFTHPFFWAPFDYIGNDTPFQQPRSLLPLFLLHAIVFLLMAVGVVFIYKKQRRVI